MGKQIRVEMSHGGGRTAKYNGDPGACFKCGNVGHWARYYPLHLSEVIVVANLLICKGMP